MKISLAAAINLKDYTFAQYNGKGAKNFTKGSNFYKLQTGGHFAYREGTSKCYFVFPGMLDVEFGISNALTDKLFEKADEPKLKRAELVKLFKAGPELAVLTQPTVTKVERVEKTEPKVTHAPKEKLPKVAKVPVSVKEPETPPTKTRLSDKYKEPEVPLVFDIPEHVLHSEPVNRTPPKNADERAAFENLKHLFQPAMFEAAYGDEQGQLDYVVKQWKALNADKFGGVMKRPVFKFLKMQSADKGKLAGLWYRDTLSLNRRLFLRAEFIVMMVLLHEMCHQYVDQILHSRDHSEGGHGPEWRAIMRKVGLEPSRYHTSGDMMITEDEADQVKSKDDLMHMALSHKRRMTMPRALAAVDVFDVDLGSWKTGVLVKPVRKGEYWAVVFPSHELGYYSNVPAEWLCMPESQPSNALMDKAKRLLGRMR